MPLVDLAILTKTCLSCHISLHLAAPNVISGLIIQLLPLKSASVIKI